ncbi:response regulator [Mycobacterium sp. GA-1841]|uniref:response regulator n=1 Tax=Mycobacterium sp. GA-1841 TaxID=1834154 RepID=UPI0020C9742A|nr:response regulator [Mycobacterium sp. GA-1841]
MDRSLRILVASPLGRIVAPSVTQALPGATVELAENSEAVRRQIIGRVRFDVVIADLVWNNPELEFTFDGLDVINVLHEANRLAPVILARQGHSMEHDLIDEARLRPEVVSAFHKSAGTGELPNLIRDAAVGKRHAVPSPSPRKPPLYELFRTRKGQTAGRMAGAIAAGRATDGASLAAAAGIGINTATKAATHYLGPIILQRGEHDPALPLSLAAVYRWCGLHSRYLVSWCRRHGHADVLQAPTVVGSRSSETARSRSSRSWSTTASPATR